MDSAHSAHSDGSTFSFLSQDSTSSGAASSASTAFPFKGGRTAQDTVPCVSSRFETLCVTLMDVPWDATEALDDWRLLYGEEFLPSVCLAAAYVLALYGSVGNPTAWETLRQYGLAQHAHAACSVGGGLLHRVCCLRRHEAADVAALLLECGASPSQVAYCPPTGALAVDERPIDCGTARPRDSVAVRSANLETLQCTQGGHMLSPLSAAAQWGHMGTLETLLGRHKQRKLPVAHASGGGEVVVHATRSTLLIPLSRGVTVVLTPLTGQMQFVQAETLGAAAPALHAPSAKIHLDTLVHACVAALVAVRPGAVARLAAAARDAQPSLPTHRIRTAPGCNELVDCSVCPLPRKQGGTGRDAAQRQGGAFAAVAPRVLPRAPASLAALAAALLLALPRGDGAAQGTLQCCLQLAGSSHRCGVPLLTQLRAARPQAHALIYAQEAWCRRRGLLLHRRQRRQTRHGRPAL